MNERTLLDTKPGSLFGNFIAAIRKALIPYKFYSIDRRGQYYMFGIPRRDGEFNMHFLVYEFKSWRPFWQFKPETKNSESIYLAESDGEFTMAIKSERAEMLLGRLLPVINEGATKLKNGILVYDGKNARSFH